MLVKIHQRQILRSLIIKTVVSPDVVRPSYHMREERYKNFGKNYLKVIVVRENSAIVIVTAHWVAKLKNN